MNTHSRKNPLSVLMSPPFILHSVGIFPMMAHLSTHLSTDHSAKAIRNELPLVIVLAHIFSIVPCEEYKFYIASNQILRVLKERIFSALTYKNNVYSMFLQSNRGNMFICIDRE